MWRRNSLTWAGPTCFAVGLVICALCVTDFAYGAKPPPLADQTACLTSACLLERFDAHDLPFLPVRVSVQHCASACANYVGGPLLFALSADPASISNTELCCAYRRFADAAWGPGAWSSTSGVFAVVFDALLGNASAGGFGGLADPLLRLPPGAPVMASFAPRGLAFGATSRAQGVDSGLALQLVDPMPYAGGGGAPADGARVVTVATINSSWPAAPLVTLPASTATLASAWRLGLLLPCDPSRLPVGEPFDMVWSSATSGDQHVTAYCGVPVTIGPILPSATVALRGALQRVGQAPLPLGQMILTASPISATRVVTPSTAQNVVMPVNATVLFVCPSRMVQRQSTVTYVMRSSSTVPSAQRTLGGMSFYSLTPQRGFPLGTYFAGVAPGAISTLSLTLSPNVWGSRATVARFTESNLNAGTFVSGEAQFATSLLTCVTNTCGLGMPIPATYTSATATYTLSTVTVQNLENNRGNDCYYTVACPAGLTGGLVAQLALASPYMLRIGGLSPNATSDVPFFIPSDQLGGYGSTRLYLDSGYFARYFYGYPSEWGIPGPTFAFDGRVYTSSSGNAPVVPGSPLQFVDFRGTVWCAAQPRCPTRDTRYFIAGPPATTTTVTIGIPPGIGVPSDTECLWIVSCSSVLQKLAVQQLPTDIPAGKIVANSWRTASNEWHIYLSSTYANMTQLGAMFRVTCADPSTGSTSQSVSISAAETASLSDSEVSQGGSPGTPAPSLPTAAPPVVTSAPSSSAGVSPTGSSQPPVLTVTPTTVTDSSSATTTGLDTGTSPAASTTPPTPAVTGGTTGQPTATTTSASSAAPAGTGTHSSVPSSRPPPAPSASGVRSTTVSLSASVSASIPVAPAPPPPTRIVIVAAAAADDGLSAFTSVPVISAIVGIVALVALVIAAVVLGPRLRAAWRKRRRTGDGPDELAVPLQDRTNQYRWYEDAEAVAQDLERRGDVVQRMDHEGLLAVPSVTTTVAAAGGAAPAAGAVTGNPLANYGVQSSSSDAPSTVRHNPLIMRRAADVAAGDL